MKKTKILSLKRSGRKDSYAFKGSGRQRRRFWVEVLTWLLCLRKNGLATPEQLEWLEENEGRKAHQWGMKHRDGRWREPETTNQEEQ